METGEKRGSVFSAKASKKGGKRMKPLTAEEEARREEVKEKLELEKRALKLVERLLEDSVAEDFLLDCAKFITTANYKDTIEERFIAKLCGYPICSNKLDKIPTQQYKISTKTNQVYDITERKCFCSNFCYKASKEFELQISRMPLLLRQYESPPEIRLLKKGDGGSSGEEVMLSERRLTEEDIENPLAAMPDDSESSAGAGGRDSSGDEREQDFVSSVVSQQQRPRVHWGDLPKRQKPGAVERRKKQNRGVFKEETKSQNTQKEEMREKNKKKEPHTKKLEQFHKVNTDQAVQKEKDLTQVSTVEEATAKLNVCSLSETVIHTATLPEHTPTGTEHTTSLTSSPLIETKPSTEIKLQPSPTLTATYLINLNESSSNRLGFNITQVGMSKRGAAGLRHLLKTHASEAKPDSVRLNLLESLGRTLKEWCTDDTLSFLYGSLGSPFADIKEVMEEEELDEDDLEDDVAVVDGQEQKIALAAAPDYETLQKDARQLELRVMEFYKGTWILPEVEQLNGNTDQGTTQSPNTKDPVLPLIDSHAQHLIQKRIAVEKLSSGLRGIVGPLHLTMSDISADLNNLVRTFRFTNTNINHKTPQWTLIAVVLLHLLSEVSPVVREALKKSASVEYLNTLMQELGLQEQDILHLVQLLKFPTH
ncbi:putative RNA polymerase II subunit B1 CTD phosphatase rpap2 isoform X2 [Leuresthes tenuis]|uniref:putative RNA polymerase II subunit B1 CTD phosphatase rpap2 isoform X2 n=1 Tax=Leuresthes tenuis TaxID=355514 RepID=UPI003B510972